MDELEKKKDIIDRLNGIDDILFQKIMEDRAAAQEILQTIMQDDSLSLVWIAPQTSLRSMPGRSVVLDCLCKDMQGRYFATEVQKADNDDHQKRVRYNGSSIDTYFSEKGITFQEVPEVFSIFLTKFDLFHSGKAVCQVRRIVDPIGRVVSNGFHEIYINAAVNDGSKAAQLMQYLLCTEDCNPVFPKVSARVQFLKHNRSEVNAMCELVEEYARERAEKATIKTAVESAQKGVKEGLPFDMAVKIFSMLSVDDLKLIYNGMDTRLISK